MLRTKTHTQSIAAATWTVTHNLGGKPIVSVKVMEAGVLTEILPSTLTFPDSQTVVIGFTSPRTGEARLA